VCVCVCVDVCVCACLRVCVCVDFCVLWCVCVRCVRVCVYVKSDDGVHGHMCVHVVLWACEVNMS